MGGPCLGRRLSGVPQQPGECRTPISPCRSCAVWTNRGSCRGPTLARRPCCSSAGRWSPRTAATRTSQTTCPPAPSAIPRWRRRCGLGQAGGLPRGEARREEEEGSGLRRRAPGGRNGPASWPEATSGAGSEACAPCSPQPHERDALLAGSLNAPLHLSNEQERGGNWPGDGPKAPEPHPHHRAHGRSKHLSGSSVSFSRDTEGGEDDDPSKVRGSWGAATSSVVGAPWPLLQRYRPARVGGARGSDIPAPVLSSGGLVPGSPAE